MTMSTIINANTNTRAVIDFTTLSEREREQWATIWETVDSINGFQTTDEFYSKGITPLDGGVKEVYARLSGWRKEAYRAFVMSGCFVANVFGVEKVYPRQWFSGNINCPRKAVDVSVHHYPLNASDWSDFTEEETKWTWEDVLKYC